MSHSTAARLLKEYTQESKDPNPAVKDLSPVSEDNVFKWTGWLQGISGTPYEGGEWLLDITIPERYPYVPPDMKFATPICHPNVHFMTGEICLDVLKNQWSPAWTISTACTAVRALLESPEPDSPLNIDAANLLRCGDQEGYDSLVRMYTHMYANGRIKRR
jgi:peroxin-4